MSQLNQDTAGVLARVSRGETLEVTNRGQAVARIGPAETDELSDLIAAGWVTPATLHGPIPMPTFVVEGDSVSAALHQMREEERW